MAKKDGVKWHAGMVMDAIHKEHPGPEQWIVVSEVPDATSFDKGRSADAIAFGCWKSAGLGIHGYEIKVSRSDWTRELQQPQKAAGFIKRCTFWWLICPEGVANVAEMPHDWGLKEVKWTAGKGYSVKIRKRALLNPEPKWHPNGIAALLRCAWRRSPEGKAFDAAVAKAYAEGREGVEELIDSRVKSATGQLLRRNTELEEAIRIFEQSSGLRISGGRWHHGVGEQVRAFHSLGGDVTRMFEPVIGELLGMVSRLRTVQGGLAGAVCGDGEGI